jgi:hypothetical protein
LQVVHAEYLSLLGGTPCLQGEEIPKLMGVFSCINATRFFDPRWPLS